MKAQSHGLERTQRQALIEHISRHLGNLDDQTLLSLADLVREPSLDAEKVRVVSSPITRRRFLTATLAGGFIAATAGTVAVWQYGSGRGQELTEELKRLWGLIRLYEKLDEIGLDSVVTTGLALVGAALEMLAGAASLVNAGAQFVEDALKKWELAFPAIREGITWLEGLVSELAQRIHLLEDAIGRALDEVSPVTQALGAFFEAILKLLPFGGGQKIKEVLDRIGEIITSIPQAIKDINVKILTPLRDDWFSDKPDRGLKGTLIDPIITKLLDPLEAMTEKLNELLRCWEKELVTPTKAALDRRAAVHKEIADYRALYRLQAPRSDLSIG